MLMSFSSNLLIVGDSVIGLYEVVSAGSLCGLGMTVIVADLNDCGMYAVERILL